MKPGSKNPNPILAPGGASELAVARQKGGCILPGPGHQEWEVYGFMRPCEQVNKHFGIHK